MSTQLDRDLVSCVQFLAEDHRRIVKALRVHRIVALRLTGPPRWESRPAVPTLDC